jgi:3-methyladenine DNA glycosylase AlkD
MNPILDKVRKELTSMANPVLAEGSKRFFKENEVINVYGIKTAEVMKLSKGWLKEISDLSKFEIFALCDELWKSGMSEEQFIACDWAYAQRKKFEPSDFNIVEKWLFSYVSNWATCDTLCNHTIGTFVEMNPEYISELKRWAKLDNRWMRRAAAVTLIIPARHGLFLDDIFEIATLLLHDRDDLVQKGYGWMLKAASQAHCNEVFNFVIRHKATMPRTALRYAIEKLPDEMKRMAMLKQ